MKQKFIIDVNPSTGEIIEKIKCSSPGEINSAVKIARKAFKFWSDTSVKSRILLFRKIVKSIRDSSDEIARKITLEIGKPIKRSLEEVSDTVKQIEQIISFAEEMLCKQIFKNGSEISEVVKTPYGVAAIISSWNYPFFVPAEYLTSAIISGNTAVLKPSAVATSTGNLLYNIFNKILPKGVINIVQGGDEVREILLDTDINIVSFIGQAEKGKRVISASVNRMQRYTLELLSKDAMIVLDDANLTSAASFAVKNSLHNSGQNANSIERIYVHYPVYEKFISIVSEKIKKIKYGNPFGDVDAGPMATEELRNKVLYQIEEARRKGAKILHGGTKPDNSGFFIEPTLIVDVSDKHELISDETFGPVIAVQKYFDLDAIIEKINRSPFGLGSTIWTKNIKKANGIAKKLDVGMIGINNPIDGVSGTPWCGIKQSGCGYMGCKESLRFFTYPKKYTY